MINARKKKRCLVIPADSWACGLERVIKPYRKLAKDNQHRDIEFHVHNSQISTDVIFANLSLYDAILFQRPTHKNIPNVIRALQSAGKKVIVEIDDRLDCVHRDNVAIKFFYPGSEALNVFFECLKIADAVHCSTPEIAEAYKLKNDKRNFTVFLNAIDLDNPIYKGVPENTKYPSSQVNVMWSGSTSHWDSIKLIRGIIETPILQNDNAHLIICGNKQFYDIFNLPEDRKTFIEGTHDVEGYASYPSHADIFISPVVPSVFNEGKSELKILEAAVWGIPCVSSPIAPYRRFNDVSSGANLLVKGNKPNEWQKQVNKLIKDETLRKELGQKSREAVEKHYNLDVENEKRLVWWEDFLYKSN